MLTHLINWSDCFPSEIYITNKFLSNKNIMNFVPIYDVRLVLYNYLQL